MHRKGIKNALQCLQGRVKRKYTKRPKPVVAPPPSPSTDEPRVPQTAPVVKKERKPNPWLAHTKAVQAQHPDKTYTEILSIAKLSYKK